MGNANFPFRGDTSSAQPAQAKDWLDRANDIFHFEDAISGRGLPPLDIPPEAIPAETAPVHPAVTPPAAVSQAAPVAGPEPIAQPSPAAHPEPDASSPTEAVPASPLTALAGAAIANAAPAPAVRAKDWTGPVQPLDREKMTDAGYIVPGMAVNGAVEEFRIIRRELLSRIRGNRHQQPIPNGNVILVTSAHPGDGKTYSSINLAISLSAEPGVEVLLIDADFAKPNVASALGLSAEKGMMDALANPDISVEDLVIRTDVPSLSVLPAGVSRDNDDEYLASSHMEEIISALVAGRPERILIFDSPPLLAASPATMLAGCVGQTILVVRADRTTEAALRDSIGLLKECDCVQLLLNGVKFSSSGRNFGSYYGQEAE